jgi:NhaP-type Na+/H+ or K+/H+ antiporter
MRFTRVELVFIAFGAILGALVGYLSRRVWSRHPRPSRLSFSC